MFARIHAATSGGTENPMCARPGSAIALSLLALVALGAGPALAGDTTTTLEASPTSVFSEPVTLTATVAATGAAPSGALRIQDGGKTIATETLVGGPLVYAALHAGRAFACALLDDDTVQCWGRNSSGQLGDGTNDGRLTPGAVTGLSGPVTDLALGSGSSHACALIDDGTVQCWGNNFRGQLGDGTTEERPIPVSVTGLGGTAIAIDAGDRHSCAILQGGSVQCWGENNKGQLGDGGTTDSAAPVTVAGLSGPATALAPGQEHTCALIQGGTVQCWGNGSSGRLGNGGTADSLTPVSVSSLSGTVTAIASGSFHTCALIDGGAMQCWGRGTFGQIGNGSTNFNNTTPQTVSGISTATAIATATVNSCAALDGGTAKCWGSNSVGALGDGTKVQRNSPVSVQGLAGTVTAMAGGAGATYALLADGLLQAWGLNTEGEFGDGTTTSTTAPVDVLDPTVSRTASLIVDDLKVGAHAFTASYGGDSDSDPSGSDVATHTVDKAKTRIRKIKLKPGKPKAGQKARATVDVQALTPATARPAGKLQVKLGRKKVANVKVKDGKAKFRLPTLAAGKQKLKVKFQKSGNFKDSAGKKTVQVRN